MICNRENSGLFVDGVFYAVGMRVKCTYVSEYSGFSGTITKILTGSDKETKNENADIYCCFTIPDDIAGLEKRFSDLYGEPKTIDDICVDAVIMASDMITIVSP